MVDDDEIRRDALAAYKSLESPNWSFVTARIKNGLYDDLVRELGKLGVVQETTDVNDDCSRSLCLNAEFGVLTLRLSLVGKYACVHDSRGRVLGRDDLSNSSIGVQILGVLDSARMDLLSESDLRSEIELGDARPRLYEVLFSSDGAVS